MSMAEAEQYIRQLRGMVFTAAYVSNVSGIQLAICVNACQALFIRGEIRIVTQHSATHLVEYAFN